MTIMEQYELLKKKKGLPEIDGACVLGTGRSLNQKLLDPVSQAIRDTDIMTYSYGTSVHGLTLISKHYAVQGIEDIRIELTVLKNGLEIARGRWYV